MEQVCARRLGVKGWLCLVGGVGAALSSAGSTPASTPAPAAAPAATRAPAATASAAAPVPAPKPLTVIDLVATDDLPGVVIFPARASGPRPITVLLHGMCGEPSYTCSHFAEQVTESSNLVCPRASLRCAGGGASWPQTGYSEAIEAAIARAKAALPEPADDAHGRTLIGYSLGAYRALEMAQRSAGTYPRVMLIGARILLNQKLLAENGVQRVLLSAGGSDMMHDPMHPAAARAAGAGMSARFLDLGPVGHAFTPSFARYLPVALAWLSAGPG
jgi:predicted esterase